MHVIERDKYLISVISLIRDSDTAWKKVLWSGETKMELFVINDLPCQKCRVQPKEHHPHCQARRWKHYALGCFSAKATGQLYCIEGPMDHKLLDENLVPLARTLKIDLEGYSSITMTQNILPKKQWSGQRRNLWSGPA